jgi:hypothetical protein
MERFNLKQLSKGEVPCKSAAVDSRDINKAWVTVRHNIKISAKESRLL